jgi:arylsulfatase A-like enzyme
MRTHFFMLFTVFILAGLLNAQNPNVVILYIDDMGYADPSCFGNPDIETPHIDKLASQGTRLTNFYTNSPICSPSRVALNTGQAPGRHKVWAHFASKQQNKTRNMVDFLDPNVQTTAKVLKANGYATAHFGKWHMGGGRDVVAPLPQAYGFDESLVSFEGLGERILFGKAGLNSQSAKLGHGNFTLVEKWESTGIYVDRAIDFMTRNKDKPFYLHMFPNDVHDRHSPREDWLEKYAKYSDDPYKQAFYAVLDNMDKQIGRLMDVMDELGIAENTILIFTSDNGPTDWPRYYEEGYNPPGWTGPFYGRKWSLYEGGIRMPFIIRWPARIKAGAINDKSIVAAIDFMPSILAMTQTPLPDHWNLDGEDMSSAFYGIPVQRSRPVFWEYAGNPGILKPGNPDFESPTNAIREGDWKLLTNDDGSNTKLFNLVQDEGETTNLTAKFPERTQTMKEQLLDWRKSL